jgi:hypothetical protein
MRTMNLSKYLSGEPQLNVNPSGLFHSTPLPNSSLLSNNSPSSSPLPNSSPLSNSNPPSSSPSSSRADLSWDLVVVLDCVCRSNAHSINLDESRFPLLVIEVSNYGKKSTTGGNYWDGFLEDDKVEAAVDPNEGSNLGRLG